MCFYWWVHTYTLAEGDTEVNEFPTVANKILKSHSEMYAHTHTLVSTSNSKVNRLHQWAELWLVLMKLCLSWLKHHGVSCLQFKMKELLTSPYKLCYSNEQSTAGNPELKTLNVLCCVMAVAGLALLWMHWSRQTENCELNKNKYWC